MPAADRGLNLESAWLIGRVGTCEFIATRRPPNEPRNDTATFNRPQNWSTDGLGHAQGVTGSKFTAVEQRDGLEFYGQRQAPRIRRPFSATTIPRHRPDVQPNQLCWRKARQASRNDRNALCPCPRPSAVDQALARAREGRPWCVHLVALPVRDMHSDSRSVPPRHRPPHRGSDISATAHGSCLALPRVSFPVPVPNSCKHESPPCLPCDRSASRIRDLVMYRCSDQDAWTPIAIPYTDQSRCSCH